MPPSALRGEIWLVDLGMAQKARPGLILSVAFLDQERAVVTYVPRTTSARATRFEVHTRLAALPQEFSMRKALAPFPS